MPRTISRAIAAVAALLVSSTMLAACTRSYTGEDRLLAAIEDGSVTIGTKIDQPGMGLREPDGSMTGLDVQVAEYVVKAIAEHRGWDAPTIEWRETPTAYREIFLQNGEVDMIAATYSINEARLGSIDFAGPYLLTHQSMLVDAKKSDITDFRDLEGKVLCSVTNSTTAANIEKELSNVFVQEYDTYSSCAEAVRQGNADAMTTDATILNGYIFQSPGNFRLVELAPEVKSLGGEYYGIGLPKGDTDGVNAINSALMEMIDDGSFDKFVDENLGKTAAVQAAEPGDFSFLDN